MLAITVRNPLAQNADNNSGPFSELDEELPFVAKVLLVIITVLVAGALYFGFVLLVVLAWLFMLIKIAHYDYVTTLTASQTQVFAVRIDRPCTAWTSRQAPDERGVEALSQGRQRCRDVSCGPDRESPAACDARKVQAL